MTPGSTEPEKYSLEEMMERLKQKSSAPSAGNEEGEWVTRADGSQAVRVRRRKRRSQQPRKEREMRTKKIRFARVLGLVVLVIFLIGALAGGVIYSNSRPFRDALIEKITASTGAEADLRQFRMNPTSANADLLTLAWPEGSPIQSLQVRGLRAETSISSFLGGAFKGTDMIGNEGTLTLRVPDASQPRRLPATIASAIDFQRISITKLHLMPGDSLPGMFQLRDTEASLYVNRGTGGFPQMRINRGKLRVPYLPDLRLDRALVEFNDAEVNLVGARMFHGADEVGEFILSGAFNPFGDSASSKISAKVSAFKIDGLIGERMGNLIAGRIESDPDNPANALRFSSHNPPAGVFNLEFKSSLTAPIVLQGFNFLNDLAILLEDPWFSGPDFESDVTGTIRRSGGVVEIIDLQLEHRNRMSVLATLRMESNGRLTGTIDVGLSPVVITTAPTRRLDPAFSDIRGGYRWITLEIGGNANAPTDNFMTQLDNPPVRTSGSTPSENAPRPPAPGGSGSFKDLTRPR